MGQVFREPISAWEEEEGASLSESAVGSEEGTRAAAEHCSLRQAGTQWPNYHTGWQAGRQAEK